MTSPPVDVERRSAEAELVESLRSLDFTGPAAEALFAGLVRYAMPILHRWQLDGTIHGRCRSVGRPLVLDSSDDALLRTDGRAREELVADVLARAWATFLRVGLRGGAWQTGGRSLSSYFVGTCVREYGAAARSWRRERHRQREQKQYGLDPASMTGDIAADGDFAAVLCEPDIAELLATLPEEMARIFAMKLDGKTYQEIGDALGMSARAVEGRVRRFRLDYRSDQ